MHAVSIVIPVWNEEKNIPMLVQRIDNSLREHHILYEIIFVDDHSVDKTPEIIKKFSKKYPISFYIKQGNKGKSYSLAEGFEKAQYQTIAMLDADLQYPPEALPEFLKKIQEGANVVVANRKQYKVSTFRKFISSAFKFLFGKLLFGLHHDVQAGFKMFTKEVYETVHFNPSTGWAFDLEFLHRAKQAGYSIKNCDITFEKRQNGESKISFVKASWEIGMNALQVKLKKIHPQLILPTERNSMQGAGIGFKKRRYITHTTLHYSQSAIQTFVTKQIFCIALIVLFIIGGLFTKPLFTLQIIIGALSFVYFVDVIFNLFLILKSLHVPEEISFTQGELAKLNNATLPLYSILCPLYKEAHVVPQFLEAINKLDYPKNKLDVLLLLEEDDTATITAINGMRLPAFVRTVIVPHSLPKTKPKACNYGLSQAKGEYLVIFDAEDIPDPLQLKKAYLGFQKVGKRVLCLQAKLNYYNPHQNILTRFFTAEYSLWFDVTLTGLQGIKTSIPLGGTSNHFRVADLQKLQGWDPFNVTEDADLGIRLFKEGYQTAIIDSTTMEEANSQFGNWIRQRSRWIKGYMQTYLVHTRELLPFIRKKGIHALIFHLTIGGKIAFILINPLLWFMTISYFVLYAFVGPAIEVLYPPVVLYMAVFSLVFGNFLFLYYYMIGCAKREQWDLVKYVYFIPFYWLMISIAGFMALYQLIFKPHYWEKTVHGLHLNKKIKKNITEAVIKTEESQTGIRFPAKFRAHLAVLITSKKIYFSGASFVIATIAANFLHYVFNAYLVRTKAISVENFGLISLISVFLYIASIPLVALESAINYKSGFLEGKYSKDYAYAFWKYIGKRIQYVGLTIAFIWIVSTPLLMRYFHSQDSFPFIIFGLVWFIGFLQAVNKGFLSGRLLFFSLSLVVLSDAIFKLLFAIFFVTIHTPHLTYLSIIFALVASFFIGLFSIKKSSAQIPLTNELQKFPKKFFFASFLSGLSTITFLSLDIVLAQHFLSPVQAGYYAYISLVGKMVYFLGNLSIQFTLPLVSRNIGARKDTTTTLYGILFFTSLLTFIGLLIFGIFGSFTVPLLLGEKTRAIIPYLNLFCLAMMCFTISRVFISYYVSHKIYTFSLVSFLLSIVQFILISWKHETIFMIVFAMLITGILNLVSLCILHLFSEYVRVFENNIADFLGLFSFDKKKQYEKNNLKILIFNWRDTKHVWAGGAELYIHELAKRWVQNGNHVTVFCGHDGYSPRKEIIDGVHVVRRGGFYTVYIWALLYYLFRFRGTFDIVIDSENGIPFFTPLFVKKPVFLIIYHIHQEVFRQHLRFPFSFIAQKIENTCMPLLYKDKTVITISESSKKEILKLGLGTDDTIDIVYPGINNNLYGKQEKTAYPSFVYVGRLKPYKNIDIAIQAFAHIVKQYPHAKLAIAGDGEMFFNLQVLTKTLQIENNVEFLGKVTEEEKISLLAKSWVALQPSTIEGWGITVIEANACGTPVIASHVNGLKDSILDGKTGMLVPVRNVAAFAGAMQICLENTVLRETLSENAYEWSKRFSWDKSAEHFYYKILYDLDNKINHIGIPAVVYNKKI